MTAWKLATAVIMLATSLKTAVCSTAGSHAHSSELIDKFSGKYYYNNDKSMNFVQAAPFENEEEKIEMLERFPNIALPKANHDMPALKINMLRRGARDELFTHDTLYNIEIGETADEVVMHCWTGDMQLTEQDQINRNQAKGKTVITLNKATGLASMDIGGGWGAEKWVMETL